MSENNSSNASPVWQKIKSSIGAASLVIFEFLKVAIIAGVTIVAVRYFLFKPFYVKGASMEPNFYDHEYLIIDELTYRFNEPMRGDVVVFRYPENPKEYFLKRIIGLPGERLKVSAGKVTVYNKEHPEGVEIKEIYLTAGLITIGEKFWVLGDNQYFVLGDNRMNSFDSRRFGPVDKNALVGRAWLRGWPLSRLQTFSAPQYNF